MTFCIFPYRRGTSMQRFDGTTSFNETRHRYYTSLCPNMAYKVNTITNILLLIDVNQYFSRQCMCCYRDPKNFERFSLVTQGIICLAVCQLKELRELSDSDSDTSKNESETKTETEKTKSSEDLSKFQDCEKLFSLVSKIFLLNFPLYAAFKHSMQSKLEEITQQELQNLNSFCDLHDTEIPIYLLRNVSLFCKTGGVHAMTLCFQYLSPDVLPVSTAHAIIAIGKHRMVCISETSN